jgi:putative exporter of polyketide antibiotics
LLRFAAAHKKCARQSAISHRVVFGWEGVCNKGSMGWGADVDGMFGIVFGSMFGGMNEKLLADSE